MIKSYKGRMITHATEVFVYRNLHRSAWSVKALSGPHKGKVVGHADELVLAGCQTKVSEAGRQRVIAEGKKNVHAGVVGRVIDLEDMSVAPIGTRHKLSYNPFRSGDFTVDGQAVHTAKAVVFDSDGKAWAHGVLA